MTPPPVRTTRSAWALAAGGAGRRGRGRGGRSLGGNALKERFLETDAFQQIYEEQYRQLYDELLASGRAVELLEGLAAQYQRNDNADTAGLKSELETLRTTLETRTNALKTDEVVVDD